MKIALPSRDNSIDDHFGHCEYFTVLTIDQIDKSILAEEIIPSPSGCGCKSNIASQLAANGVTLLLAGNMGDGAVRVLEANGIEVIRGCHGDINMVANKWLQGEITDSGEICHEHDHHHQ